MLWSDPYRLSQAVRTRPDTKVQAPKEGQGQKNHRALFAHWTLLRPERCRGVLDPRRREQVAKVVASPDFLHLRPTAHTLSNVEAGAGHL